MFLTVSNYSCKSLSYLHRRHRKGGINSQTYIFSSRACNCLTRQFLSLSISIHLAVSMCLPRSSCKCNALNTIQLSLLLLSLCSIIYVLWPMISILTRLTKFSLNKTFTWLSSLLIHCLLSGNAVLIYIFINNDLFQKKSNIL